jgi:pyruvate/2-oxoglutarate/acetoin dehydrogenase E1 component
MSRKSYQYAVFEGIVQAAKEFDNDILIAGPGNYRATFPGLPDIDFLAEFGRFKLMDYSAIDEVWYGAAAVGAALAGMHTVLIHDMYMCALYPAELITQHAAKLHHMTGGQATCPAVFKIAQSNQAPGMAGQHSDYEDDTFFAHTPGLKTVVPSTVYDAKGLMVAALRSGDPVVYLEPAAMRALVDDVPDEIYEVPIGKAVLRTEGTDITIVGNGPSMPDVMRATERLQAEGISVEAIDLRSLHPMDTETLVKSAAKTGHLLTVDQGKYTLCPGTEVIARVAEGVPGVKVRRLAHPDAPPPGAPEMFNWIKVDANKTYGAAKLLLG